MLLAFATANWKKELANILHRKNININNHNISTDVMESHQNENLRFWSEEYQKSLF